MFKKFRLALNVAAHLPRYREIITILLKYGFADLLKLALLENYLGIHLEKVTPADEEGILSQPLAVRIRLALEELGPTFVKLGQIISSRRDLIDDSYYQELKKLQASVPPFPTEQVYEVVESELGKKIDQVFASFAAEPSGSGSIAQVHRATLLGGQEVAVKVQRPDILSLIEQDVAILSDLALFLEENVPEFQVLHPQKVVAVFTKTLFEELDFTHEAKNRERFAACFENNEDILIPTIWKEWSTHHLLLLEFVEGYSISELALLKKGDINLSSLAKKLAKLTLDQIFHFGFFHADPHPGNLVVLPGGKIGLYDYGMMGSLGAEFRMSLAKMMLGLIKKNPRQVMDALLEMSEGSFVEQPASFLTQVEELLEEDLASSLQEIRLERVLSKLLALLRKHALKMKGDFYLGIKALTQVEAIGRELDPHLNFVLLAKPYAIELIEAHYHPRRLLKIFMQLLGEGIDFLDEFPQDLRLLYHQLKEGRLQLPVKHCIDPKGIEPLRETLDSIFNRLVNGLLASALLIASALLVHSNMPPKVFGVPLFGLIGFCIGFFLSLRLAFSIWKHGGL